MVLHKYRYFYLCVLVATSVIVFGNTLLNGFVWDDVVFKVGNAVYKDFNLSKMLFSCGNGFEYRPLRDITRAIDFALWGDSPAGHHFGNLLLYAGVVIALYFTFKQLCKFLYREQPAPESVHQTIAFWGALLFSVHPTHSEVVAFLGSRSALLSGLFGLGCCYFFLLYLQENRPDRSVSFSLSLGCYIAAQLSYPASISVPLILLYFVCIDKSVRLRKNMYALVPFFALSGVFFLVHKYVAKSGGAILDSVQGDIGFQTKLAKAVEICFFYLRKFFLPINLSPEYDVVFATSLLKPLILIELLLLLIVIVLAVKYRSKYPEILCAVCWYFATLLPVANFFETNPVVADRYSFLPTVAVFFLLPALLLRTATGNRNNLIKIFAVLLSCGWAFLAYQQNKIWRDDRSLWTEGTIKSPGLVKAYQNLGVTFLDEGNYPQALEYFSPMSHINLHGAAKYDFFKGVIHEKKGELSQAVEAYQRSLDKEKDSIMTLFYLGGVYYQMGYFAQAIAQYGDVIISREVDPEGLKLKAIEQREIIEKEHFQQLDILRKRMHSDRDTSSLAAFALQLDKLGYYEEALGYYLEAEKQNANYWQLYFNIANIYQKLRNYQKAAVYYEKSLAINPVYPDSLNSLGVVYKAMKRYPQALAAFEKATEFNRNFPFAYYNIATTYYSMGENEKALASFRYVKEHFPELEIKVRDFLKKLEGIK